MNAQHVENREDVPGPTHQDSRVPAREDCVVRYLIDKWATETPEIVYAIFENGDTWTYRQLRDEVISVAAGLARRGVTQGDHVAVWLFGGREGILTFFAINYLGGVFVPFNTAYKGSLLEHVLKNSDAKLLVAHKDLVPRLADVDTALLTTVVAVGGQAQGSPLACEEFAALAGQESELPALQRPIEPWDNQSIIYTSGTTGPSKGVLSSYLHLFTNAGPETWHFVKGSDRFLINMPLFHIGGMGIISVMLARGGSIAVMETFDTERFWPFVRETKTSAAFLLGVMATFLLKQQPSAEDKNHSLRLAFMVPMTEAASELHTRFGIDIYTIFNMTEISSPIVSDPNPPARGTCGKKREGVEVRLVDENDCEVGIGEIGEMLVRTDRPWGMNSGYYKNPQATAEAWRNGWFHTGDCFRRDDAGYYYFVDRRKDAIRRRGENISSFEVEAEVVAYPAVREAAAYGVPSDLSEDDVMICVAPVEGQSIDPVELTQFLIQRMAYFMVPRYIRILNELPKTPSAKVLKHVLRAEAVTGDTWDREVAGIKVKREALGK
ncbi:MAG: AMP-binding protein [Congregibacter sp.]|nr:AMP-binding protein [Congregibacter sp.]